MQSSTHSDQSLEEWLKQYQDSWRAEFDEKGKVWFEHMTHEDRIEYIRQVFATFTEIARQDKGRALMEFIAWLRSPDGALAWPYLWKPEYRDVMTDVAAHFISVVHKLIVKQQAVAAQQQGG